MVGEAAGTHVPSWDASQYPLVTTRALHRKLPDEDQPTSAVRLPLRSIYRLVPPTDVTRGLEAG